MAAYSDWAAGAIHMLLAHDSSTKSPAAHQFSVIVFNLAGALIEVAQGRLFPLSILLLAVGQERAAAGPDILASLGVATIRRAVLLIVMSVALPIVASVTLLVPLSVAVPPVAPPTANQAAVVILNSSGALVEVRE